MHFFNSRVIEQTTNTDFTAELKLSICLSPSLNKTLSTSKIDPRSQHINAFEPITWQSSPQVSS